MRTSSISTLSSFTWQALLRNETIGIIVLAIVYAVGITAISLNINDNFIYLTPYNLLFSIGLVLWFHPEWSINRVIYLAICFFLGYFYEVVGVQTGLIFGNYAYGDVLGFKIWDTPPLIGVNWLMLVYCSGIIANHVFPKLPYFLKAIFAASLMVGLDFFIEPVAIAFNFWNWEGDVIPIQNYIGWFIMALVLSFGFQFIFGKDRNKVAIALFILQLLFFIVLGI
ncbi:MAG: carotenoid biosynthesis protein [Bacteroidota bacterium]